MVNGMQECDRLCVTWPDASVEVGELIDKKRAYNMDIVLSRIRLPVNDIRDAILQCNETIMTEERVSALLKYVPTKDEIELVTSYKEPENLGHAESFILAVSSIPHLQERLECLLFKLQFEGLVQAAENMVGTVENANKEVKESKSFREVLQFLLVFGNYMVSLYWWY